jgi:flagellar basal body-associated protein FliL
MKSREPYKRSPKETFIEIISLIVFAALAVGIWIFFGMNPWNLPFGTLALIGLGVLIVVVSLIALLLHFTAKKRGNKNDTP